jgi:high-affinity iron transporter
MLGAAIIVFREVVEAGIIVGILLAVTKGVPGRGRWIAAGVGAGVAGAALLAVFAGEISNALAGIGLEVFNAGVLGVAVIMLAWHNLWMTRHGRELAAQMKDVGTAVANGSRPLTAVAIVVAVAVLREGSEIALFLYGLVIAGGLSAWSLVAGGLIGLLLGCGVATLTFLGLVRIPGRYLFGVTTFLITFLAAGLAAQSVVFLQQAGIVTVLEGTVWDTSAILSDSSLFGRVLHTLIGYTDQPSGMQILVYVLTLIMIFGSMKLFKPSEPAKRSAVIG